VFAGKGFNKSYSMQTLFAKKSVQFLKQLLREFSWQDEKEKDVTKIVVFEESFFPIKITN